MTSFEMQCPRCKQDIVINCDHKGPLDGECPECGEKIGELVQEEWIGSLTDWSC